MLQNLREKFTGWVAITILAVIGVTFVFVGGANFTFTGNNYAAKVDDAEIGLNQFEAAYRDQLLQDPQLSQASDGVRLRVRTAILEQLIGKGLGVLDDLLCISDELGCVGFIEGDGNSGQGVHVRAALKAGKYGSVNVFGVISLE